MSLLGRLIKPYNAVIKIDEALNPEEERPYSDWFGTGIKNVTLRKCLAWNQLRRWQKKGYFNEGGKYYFYLFVKDDRIHYKLYKMPGKKEIS